ncbi:hypothetical protein GCM10022420_029410 [Streptomyces iranensis]
MPDTVYRDFGTGYVPRRHADIIDPAAAYLNGARHTLLVAVDDSDGAVVATAALDPGARPGRPTPLGWPRVIRRARPPSCAGSMCAPSTGADPAVPGAEPGVLLGLVPRLSGGLAETVNAVPPVLAGLLVAGAAGTRSVHLRARRGRRRLGPAGHAHRRCPRFCPRSSATRCCARRRAGPSGSPGGDGVRRGAVAPPAPSALTTARGASETDGPRGVNRSSLREHALGARDRKGHPI